MKALLRIKGSELAWENIHSSDDDKVSFLMWLVRQPLSELGKAILRQTQNWQVVNAQGDTVLNHAVDGQNLGTVTFILDLIPNDNARRRLLETVNHNGDYPLAYAVHTHNRPMLQLLLHEGGIILDSPNTTNVLLEAVDWDPDLSMFTDLLNDVRDPNKYEWSAANHLINHSRIFCEKHQKYHNLWDIALTHKNHAFVDAMKDLIEARQLEQRPIA
jgi:hypothetical protein